LSYSGAFPSYLFLEIWGVYGTVYKVNFNKKTNDFIKDKDFSCPGANWFGAFGGQVTMLLLELFGEFVKA